MYGHLMVEEGVRGWRATIDREKLCGLPVLRARVPLPGRLKEKSRERRIYKAALRMWSAGVSQVLVPPGFSWWPTLRQAGLARVETEELCQALAGPLTLAALSSRGWEAERAVVCLAGERVTTRLVRAAELLATRVCRLVVEVPVGGLALAEYLHVEYGLPVLPAATVRPAVTVAFDPSWQGKGPALRLWGESPDLMGVELWSPGVEPPENCESLALLAALWESGLLPGGILLARSAENSLDISGENKYNTTIKNGVVCKK